MLGNQKMANLRNSHFLYYKLMSDMFYDFSDRSNNYVKSLLMQYYMMSNYTTHQITNIDNLALILHMYNIDDGIDGNFAINFAICYHEDKISKIKLNDLGRTYNCPEKEILDDPVKFPEYYKSNVVNDSNRGIDEKGKPLFYFT